MLVVCASIYTCFGIYHAQGLQSWLYAPANFSKTTCSLFLLLCLDWISFLGPGFGRCLRQVDFHCLHFIAELRASLLDLRTNLRKSRFAFRIRFTLNLLLRTDIFVEASQLTWWKEKFTYKTKDRWPCFGSKTFVGNDTSQLAMAMW